MTIDPIEMKERSSQRPRRFGWLMILKLVFAGLPTIAFGVFTIIFSLQQESSSKATRDQDQQQADEINRRIMFKEYIDDMKELLLDESFAERMDKSLLHMRVQTLTVLKYLDTRRKHDVILYLYENGLIRHDQSPSLDLRGADLTGLKFFQSSTASCDLSFLYLPGIYGTNIVFNHCSLNKAIFDDAQLINAQFRSCDLNDATFARANLTKAQLIDNALYRTTFADSSLVQSTVRGGILVKVTFSNTDLYQSDISEQLLFGHAVDGSPLALISNTRFPNGSFSPINQTLLINNHSPKFKCPSNTTEQLTKSSGVSNCIFLARKLRFNSLDIDMREISLLIDSGQAKFNLSTLLTINHLHTDEDISMAIVFKERSDPVDGQCLSQPIRPQSLENSFVLSGTIRPKTRFLSIRLICEMDATSSQFCRFNHLALSIVNGDGRG